MDISQSDHKHSSRFPSTLQHIYHDLQTNNTDATKEITVSRDGLDFLGIRRSLKSSLDMTNFRSSLASLLNIQNDFRLVQIVGDSGVGFTPSAVKRIVSLIRDVIGDTASGSATTVIEYGYTASKHDTNWIVNELIAQDHGVAERTVGNVVYESAKAVREWGCEATGLVRRFVLVYDEKSETRFGDDLFVSDGVMRGGEKDGEGYGDVMICVEGGVQSLEQICGVLRNGVKVVAVTGRLREEGDVSASASRFSAARSLRDCVDMLSDGVGMEEVENELMDILRKRGCFIQKPEMDERVRRCLRGISMDKEKLKYVRVVPID